MLEPSRDLAPPKVLCYVWGVVVTSLAASCSVITLGSKGLARSLARARLD